MAANDAVPDPGPVTKFHALRPPSISIYDYCIRIYKYASCSPECFVLALVYIDRLIQRNSLLLTSLNVHRIIITAVMLAAKFFDDQYFNNAYYAKVGGVPTGEVNSLELEFLFSINFSLHVPTEVFEKYYSELANHMGVGVPPDVAQANTSCECPAFAQHVSYTQDELRHTGMRMLPDIGVPDEPPVPTEPPSACAQESTLSERFHGMGIETYSQQYQQPPHAAQHAGGGGAAGQHAQQPYQPYPSHAYAADGSTGAAYYPHPAGSGYRSYASSACQSPRGYHDPLRQSTSSSACGSSCTANCCLPVTRPQAGRQYRDTAAPYASGSTGHATTSHFSGAWPEG